MGNTWVIFRGQTGAVRTGRASDGDGYVDLSVYDSVSVVVKRTLNSVAVINEEVTIAPDQVVNKGSFSFTFDAQSAGIASSRYDYCSLVCMDGANPTYFPLSRRGDRTYFRLVVNEPVG